MFVENPNALNKYYQGSKKTGFLYQGDARHIFTATVECENFHIDQKVQVVLPAS
jgi:hypothetical protein